MSSPYEDNPNLTGGATAPLSGDGLDGGAGVDYSGSSAGVGYSGSSAGSSAGGDYSGSSAGASSTDYSSTSGGGSTSTRPDVSDESVGSIFSRLTTDLSTLMHQEVELAKLEMKEEAKKTGKAAGMLAGAGFAGWMFAIFLSTWLMWLLGNALESYTWGALIVALLWGAAAAALAVIGRKKLQEVNPKPEQTVQTLKEDAEWLKAQKN